MGGGEPRYPFAIAHSLNSGFSHGGALTLLSLFTTCLESKKVNPLPGGQVLIRSLWLGLQPRQSIHLSQPQCAPFGSGDSGLVGLP